MSLLVTWCERAKKEDGGSVTQSYSPVISTYAAQINECVEQYARLLRKYPPSYLSTPAVTSGPDHGGRIFPDVHAHPDARDYGRNRVFSRGRLSRENGRDNRISGTESRGTSNTRIDPLELIGHLESRGYGTPGFVTSSDQKTSRILPINIHARLLPKNPSSREKIIGRARLDYELANMKADAFCEQQRGRYFRTASANLRNRDVRFQEEELREQMRREQASDGMENIISIVASPLDRDELFLRIEAWIESVENALAM